MADSNKPDKTNEPEIRYVPVQFIEGYAPQTTNDEVEIDLQDILKRIWDGRRTILKTTTVFVLIGVLYALGSPNEYTTTTKLLPEAQQLNNLGRFGGLAAQFGLGGSSSSATMDVLPPQIYPEILTSTDFLHEIIKKKVYFEEIQDSITIQEFYNEYKKSNPFIGYTIGLPFKALALMRSSPDSIINSTNGESKSYKLLSSLEIGSIGGLRQSVTFNRDQTTGILTINVATQFPEVTVQLANHIIESLSQYLTNYRTEKSRQNLSFLEQRHEEARINFEIEQKRLANFRDQNQGNLTASAKTNEQNIQSEYDIKFNVYNSLTEQLEQARLKLQQDTPVISIIQANYYPLRASNSNKVSITLTFAIIGLFISTFWVIVSKYYNRLLIKIK